jgi:hypothetical protein
MVCLIILKTHVKPAVTGRDFSHPTYGIAKAGQTAEI